MAVGAVVKTSPRVARTEMQRPARRTARRPRRSDATLAGNAASADAADPVAATIPTNEVGSPSEVR
jgi:hypothetical protein